MKRASRFATLPAWSRRDFLRVSGLAAAGLALPSALLSGCGSSSGGTGGGQQSTPLTVDPATPWWLQNGYEPVFDELDVADLAVKGHIPSELNGLYVRNGSNPQAGDSPHWFFGDGMVHGVRFERGRAAWYRNRYIRTPLYLEGRGFDSGLPPVGGNNQSNVSCVWHGGTLLTSGEVGFPHRLNPGDLSTMGVHDFDGALLTSFTAHPKIDPVTGYLHFFGYWFVPPYLTYSVADATGRVIHRQEIEVAASTMIHSFAITEQDVIFWELPVLFDLAGAINGADNPFYWKAEYGARIGVMPLGGLASEIRWVEIDPCYVFHEVNAYREGDEVVLDLCRHDHMFANDDLDDTELTLRRWRIGTGGTQLTFSEEIVTDQQFELPSHDRRFSGRKHRYGWFVESRPHDASVDLGGIGRFDYQTGRSLLWDAGLHRHANEAFFVAGGRGEGDGWLLTLVYDRAEDATDLCILDAHRPDRGPVAEIRLPRRVPHGFHAAWVPA
jgi:carotenoid cleavage dioxygenase